MGGQAGEQGAGRFLREPLFCQCSGGPKSAQTKRCKLEWMTRQMEHGLKKFVGQIFPVREQRGHQPLVGKLVRLAEPLSRLHERAL